MALLDLIRPKWKHSNPGVRLQAVKDMDVAETERLEVLARTDEDVRVRTEAVKKISNKDFLTDLVVDDASDDIKQTALHQLNLLYRDEVLNATDGKAALALIRKITDEAMLAELVCDIEFQDARQAAIEQIEDPELLCRITENNCGLKTADTILERLADADHLRRVADHASNKKIRKKAVVKLDRILNPVQPPSPEEVQTEQLTTLCEQLEACRTQQDRVNAAILLAKSKTQWNILSPGSRHSLSVRFEAAVRRIETELANVEAVQQANDALDQICTELEAALSAPPEDLSAFQESLERRWQAVDASVLPKGQTASFDERYEAAMTSLEAAVERRQADEAERREKLENLERLCTRGEEMIQALAADAPVHEENSAWEAIEAQWTNAWFDDRFDDPEAALLKERFDSLSAKYQAQIEIRKEAFKNRQAEEEAALKALIRTVKEAVDAENRAGLDQTVKDAQQKWRESGEAIPEVKAGLEDAFQDACSRFFTVQRAHWENLEWERWANLNQKEELCRVVELLNEKEILEGAAQITWETRKKWREIGPVSRDKADEIWSRFNAACDRVYQRSLARKQALFDSIKELTLFSPETDMSPVMWSDTAEQVKALQKQWNDIGVLPNSLEQSLRDEYQEACNTFFEKLRNFYRQLDDERQANLKKKTAMCEEAESLADSTLWHQTAARMRTLQREWKQVGPVPRSDGDDTWNRFRNACNCFFERMKEQEPENLARKEALCEQVESLLQEEAEDADMEKVRQDLMAIQREWKEIGPVSPEKADALWQRFQAPCDAFFMKWKEYQKKQEAEQLDHQQQKEALVNEAGALAESTEWKETGERLKQLQQQWKEIGPAPWKSEKELWEKFQDACNRFFTRQKSFFQQKEQDRQENLKQKEQLCISLEALARLVLPEDALTDHEAVPAAEQLQFALKYKNEVVVPGNLKETWDRTIQKVQAIQREWKTIGPVPYEKEEALWKRFQQAADIFFSTRSESDGLKPPPEPHKDIEE